MRAVLDPRADRKRAAQMGNVDSDKSYVRYVLADAHARHAHILKNPKFELYIYS